MKNLPVFVFLFLCINLFARPAFYPLPSQKNGSAARADSLHGFDVLHYDLKMNIDEQAHFIRGKVTATVNAQVSLSSLEYELVALTVDSVKVNSQPIFNFNHQNGILNIPVNMEQGTEFTTEVTYHGNPTLSGGAYNLGMFFSNTAIFTIADPNAARYFWPCYDHPWDKALVDLHITVRGDWLVAANGIRTEIVDNHDGTKTHHWQGHNPLATYLVSIVCGNFSEINANYGSIPIQNFVPPAMLANAQHDFSSLPEMMSVLSEKYGDYPFEKYGNAVVNFSTFGAMEHQTMTTLDDNYIDGNNGGAYTILHELAHSWFGDAVTPLTWKDVWLSESFATYSEAVYCEHEQGYTGLSNYVESEFQNYYRNWENAAGPRIIYNPPYAETFYPYVYQKGALVLHQLRLKLGDVGFFRLMQQYFAMYKNKNAVTSEFISLAEQVSGQDLTQFFRQWVYSGGLPTSLDLAFFKQDNTLKVISQTHSTTATAFVLDVPVYFNQGADSLLITAYPDQDRYFVCQNAPENLNDVQIDPHKWVPLTERNIILPAISFVLSGADNIRIYPAAYPFTIPLHYQIYRAQHEEGPYELLGDTAGEAYTDFAVTAGQTYFYKIKVTDNEGFSSAFSAVQSSQSLHLPLNSGVLVVDETRDGTGSQPITPTDEAVDGFYHRIVMNNCTTYDVAASGFPSLTTLGNFSTVIWHDDDYSQKMLINNWQTLLAYVNAGGKLLLSGWKTSLSFDWDMLRSFGGDFSGELVTASNFSGAISDTYPALSVDETKVPAGWAGKMNNILYFTGNTDTVYRYVSDPESEVQDSPCAIRITNGGQLLILGFPLYFMEESGARAFVSALLTEFGETVAADHQTPAYVAPVLTAYPSPFSAGTVLRVELKTSESQTKIEVFNIKGQKIQTAKQTLFYWDGKDAHGKEAAAGVYFVRAKTEKWSLIKKVVKLK